MPLSFQFANNIFCSNLLLYYCHYIQFLKVCVTYNTYKLFLIETQLVWYSYDTTVEDTPLLNKAQASPGVTCTKPCRTNPTWTTLWKQWPLWKHTKSEWKHNIQLNCVCPPQCMVLSSCHVENKQQSRSIPCFNPGPPWCLHLQINNKTLINSHSASSMSLRCICWHQIFAYNGLICWNNLLICIGLVLNIINVNSVAIGFVSSF